MIGLQEMKRLVDKEDNKELGKQVKEMVRDRGYFDYDEFNLWGTGERQRDAKVTPMGGEDKKKIWESIKAIPLKEFLARSGTTGIAGAAYLIPTKIYQIMFDSAVEEDKVAQISIGGTIIPAEQIGGATMNVDIAVDGSYTPKPYSSGGKMPTETIATEQATLDFTNPFGINLRISNDLIEDSQFDVIEMHIRDAGREMGEYATHEAAIILMTSTDGDGTLNTEGAGADVTTLTDVMNAVDANLRDGYVSDTYLLSHHLIWSEIAADTTYSQDANEFRNRLIIDGYPTKLLGMDMVYSEVPALSNPLGVRISALPYTDLNSYVFDKDFALLSGRKRWLRIENYSEPVSDLVGATVTARQDSVTIYNDSICRVREA